MPNFNENAPNHPQRYYRGQENQIGREQNQRGSVPSQENPASSQYPQQEYSGSYYEEETQPIRPEQQSQQPGAQRHFRNQEGSQNSQMPQNSQRYQQTPQNQRVPQGQRIPNNYSQGYENQHNQNFEYPYNVQPGSYETGAINQNNYNTLSIVSFISSFFINIVGIITGVIALTQIKMTRERGKGLAIAGIVIGAVSILFFMLILMGLNSVYNSIDDIATSKTINGQTYVKDDDGEWIPIEESDVIVEEYDDFFNDFDFNESDFNSEEFVKFVEPENIEEEWILVDGNV